MRTAATCNNLITFTVGVCGFRINEKRFEPEMKLMAKKCQQIKAIDICYAWDYNEKNNKPIELSSLKQFKRLRKLEISVYNNNVFNDQSFKGLEQLTHLTIRFSEKNIGEPLLTNIIDNVPNLKHLSIDIRGRYFKATENTAELLCRLSKLKSISMNIEEESIRRLIETKLIKICKYIINFQISEL